MTSRVLIGCRYEGGRAYAAERLALGADYCPRLIHSTTFIQERDDGFDGYEPSPEEMGEKPAPIQQTVIESVPPLSDDEPIPF